MILERPSAFPFLRAQSNLLRILQHGPCPRGHVFTIGFRVLGAHIQNRLRPFSLLEDWQTVSGGDLEFPFAAIQQPFVLLSDESWCCVLDEKYP